MYIFCKFDYDSNFYIYYNLSNNKFIRQKSTIDCLGFFGRYEYSDYTGFSDILNDKLNLNFKCYIVSRSSKCYNICLEIYKNNILLLDSKVLSLDDANSFIRFLVRNNLCILEPMLGDSFNNTVKSILNVYFAKLKLLGIDSISLDFKCTYSFSKITIGGIDYLVVCNSDKFLVSEVVNFNGIDFIMHNYMIMIKFDDKIKLFKGANYG